MARTKKKLAPAPQATGKTELDIKGELFGKLIGIAGDLDAMMHSAVAIEWYEMAATIRDALKGLPVFRHL